MINKHDKQLVRMNKDGRRQKRSRSKSVFFSPSNAIGALNKNLIEQEVKVCFFHINKRLERAS